MVTRIRNAPPRATSLIESLRGLGYSTATAVADIVDNSISAKANEVDITIEWNGEGSWIRICDNGLGMTDPDLESAMQLGTKDPRDERESHDLGRFGMGLKTASFSQARRLTVASKTVESKVACLRWDLDLLDVYGNGEWPLYEGASVGSEFIIEPLDEMTSGTLVVWEVLDRIVVAGFSVDDMLELADTVARHLSMTFHRLIADEIAGERVTIKLNGQALKPWDPFMMGHPSKAWQSSDFKLGAAGDVVVQCHVLPHADRLSVAELKHAFGPEGWISHEGFYIYRNRRLLTFGGWLRLRDPEGRLFTQDELHRLARIKLDIPNTADSDWNINVLKSAATPPVRLRSDLIRLAQETRERARKVFVHRGKLVKVLGEKTGGLPDIWVANRNVSGTSYRIARDHDLVRSVLNRAGPLKKDMEVLIKLIEGMVPVQRIWLDTAEDNEPPRNTHDDAPDNVIVEMLHSLYDALVNSTGLTPDDARARLAKTNPFDKRPDIVAAALSELDPK